MLFCNDLKLRKNLFFQNVSVTTIFAVTSAAVSAEKPVPISISRS